MNRIIIIGNGFDKAHNLATGYSDFLNHLKDSIAKYEKTGASQHKQIIRGIACKKSAGYFHRKTSDEKEDQWIGVKQIPNELKFKLAVNPHNKSIYFKSLIQENENLGYWSDLESHYFKTLYKHKNSISEVNLINAEFEHLKNLLFGYLKIEIEDKLTTESMHKNRDYVNNPILQMLEYGNPKNKLIIEKNYFVTFNFTSKILNQYVDWLRISVNGKEKFSLPPIHIHGDLVNKSNPIIFGYGDENSNEYKELELLENNELLKNFKTFQYLRSTKYNEVLGLLESSDEIYVQIIGHSSGLCDKALLRIIFQHEKVKHIEPTYYSDESKYFENLYNISRIFDDNTLMRKKITSLDETFKIE